MVELKEFLNELSYIDKFVYSAVFYDKDYEKDNAKFKLFYKVADNLTLINTPKMYIATDLLKILPAAYVDIILDIAAKLKPANKDYYKQIKLMLIDEYVARFKKIVKDDDVGLFTCETEKYKKKLLNLEERVMDLSERIDIILTLDYDVLELTGRYKGTHKSKKVLNDLCKQLMHTRYKKLEDLKDQICEPAVNKILTNLEKVDEKINLRLGFN